LAIALVLAAGLWLRAHGASEAGLRRDESGTLWAARGSSLLETVRRAYAVHGQSPLSYLIVRGTTSVLGESEATLRLPSLIAGALTPLLGYLALARAKDRSSGALALVLLAFDPLLVAHSGSARPYALAEAATLGSLVGLAAALETGSARARALLWGSAVFAVYAHAIFSPLVPALAAAVLLARAPCYGARAMARDAAWTLVLLAPELGHLVLLFARRAQLAWVGSVDPGIFGLLARRPLRPPLALALGAALLALGRGRHVLRGASDRGVVSATALGLASSVSLVLGLLAMGSNLVADRYLSLGVALAPVLAGRALALLPRWLAAGSIVAFAAIEASPFEARARQPGPVQEWREAGRYLDLLAPQAREPVLLSTGFVEQNLVLRPGALGPEQASFVVAPLALTPGRADRDLRWVILPRELDRPGESEYLARTVLPSLVGARRFFVVASEPDARRIEEQLRAVPGLPRFRETATRAFEASDLPGPILVARLDATD
jgi:hypothetical protein